MKQFFFFTTPSPFGRLMITTWLASVSFDVQVRNNPTELVSISQISKPWNPTSTNTHFSLNEKSLIFLSNHSLQWQITTGGTYYFSYRILDIKIVSAWLWKYPHVFCAFFLKLCYSISIHLSITCQAFCSTFASQKLSFMAFILLCQFSTYIFPLYRKHTQKFGLY